MSREVDINRNRCSWYEDELTTQELPITNMLKQYDSVDIFEIIEQVRTLELELIEEIKELQHFRDSSIGLLCTDKQEAILEDKKYLFFQLK